jgi:nitrite reductase/ring-hydroxylating ferredoxin subunit
VETEKGVFKAKNIIYATHIPPGVNLLHLRCAPFRSYAMAVRIKSDTYPPDLAYDMYDPYHYYRTQKVNGQNFLIVGGEDHKTGHEENTEKPFLRLESHIRKFFQIESIEYKWSSQYFEPADGLPYIGHLPGHSENIYVATGYGGNGITYGTAAALILKELLLNEQEKKYSHLFNPNRIKPIAGFTNFLRHNADVAKLFVSKWFSHEDLEQFANLAPGEGKVVKYEENKMALFKDDEGVLHAINPICKHLKCEVKWNVAERSWDCPCHGARYSYDGKMMTGPADNDLEAVRIEELVKHD